MYFIKEKIKNQFGYFSTTVNIRNWIIEIDGNNSNMVISTLASQFSY